MDEAAASEQQTEQLTTQQDNTTFICDVEEILENSFFNKSSLNIGYVLTMVEPIKNDNTQKIYKYFKKEFNLNNLQFRKNRIKLTKHFYSIFPALCVCSDHIPN